MSVQQYGGLIERVAVTATAGGTTTLNNLSQQVQVFTGTLTQSIVLPDATTFTKAGAKFEFYNTSTSTLTIRLNDTSVLATVASGNSYLIKLTNNSTTNGTWVSFNPPATGGGTYTPSDIFVAGGVNSGTVTRSYQSVLNSVGTGITYTSDTVNGDFFTINDPGVYSITISDGGTTSPVSIGITQNANNTTSINGLVYSTGFRAKVDLVATSNAYGLSTDVRCVMGDVIRMQQSSVNPGLTGTPTTVYFHIQKISN